MATDPVCGMSVDEQSPAGTLNDAGTLYYFCSTDCLNQFAAKIDALARLEQSKVQIGTICKVDGPVVDIICEYLPPLHQASPEIARRSD